MNSFLDFARGLLYEDGDYGFYNVRLSNFYIYLSREYMMLKDFANALNCVEKSVHYSIAFDTLPEDFKHTSIAVKYWEYSSEGNTKNYDYNSIYRLLNNELATDIFDPLREYERFNEIVAELEKYAKKESN